MAILCLRDLGLWLSLIPDEAQKNSDPSSCPPSPVCTEWLPPTQVNRYSQPKLSFAPNFRNSISMYSLPNKNSRKLTLADGPHDFAQRGHRREVPQNSSANKDTEQKSKQRPLNRVALGSTGRSQLLHSLSILRGSSTQGPYSRGASLRREN